MVQKTVKLSMLQMSSVIGDIEANIDKVKTLVENELPPDCDVLILPEVWTVGWACSHFIETANKLNSGVVFDFLSSLAKKYNINVIGGSIIEASNGEYYNTCPVFDRDGKLVAKYSKMHLYSYYGCNEGTYITEGKSPVMVELDGVNYGLTICYDIRFPEIYRAYAKAGADILVNSAAWGAKKPIPWEMMTKSRAIENQCYMAALTQSGPIEDGEFNLGHSRIIDYKGDEVAAIMDGEGIVTGELDLDAMYKFRHNAPTMMDIKNNYEVKILCKR